MKDERKTGAQAEPADAPRDEAFLARWSRLKRASESGPEDSAVTVAPGTGAAAAEDGAELPGDEDMPSLESLDGNSDYSGFLSPKVSENLRLQALRKLFHAPKFNVCDGLDDYCENYRNLEPLGDIVTAEMRYRMKKKLEQTLAGEAETEEAVAMRGDQEGAATDASEDRPAEGTEQPKQPERGDGNA
jgi:hypothetical protein